MTHLSPIGPHHDTSSLKSGWGRLDTYLKRQALVDARAKRAMTYVLTDGPKGTIVNGFVTVSSLQFLAGGPAPMPGGVITHLAIRRSRSWSGDGRLLLAHALEVMVDVQRDTLHVGVVAIAPEPEAAAFYQRYGFRALVSDESKMFIFSRALLASYEEVRGRGVRGES